MLEGAIADRSVHLWRPREYTPNLNVGSTPRLHRRGRQDRFRGVAKEGFTPVKELIESFVAEGGAIWACGACTKPRGITDDQLIDGAKIVTASNIVEVLASGAATLNF